MKKRWGRVVQIMLVLCVSSCQAIDPLYDQFHIIRNTNGTGYVWKETNSERLVIYIEGSGLNSVLGIKDRHTWKELQLGYFIVTSYAERAHLLIPEKLTMEPGHDYQHDRKILASYTVGDLIDTYVKTIDAFLSASTYSSIVMIGASEGGLLLPAIYNKLSNKASISHLVVIGAGGFSQYECFKVLGTSSVPMPQEYRQQCLLIEAVKAEIDADPNSLTRYYLGWPYKRWSTFFSYRPFEEYATITIPVLFVQGALDWSSPVESVKYLETHARSNTYEFRYYEHMGHIPEHEHDIRMMLDEIAQWFEAAPQ